MERKLLACVGMLTRDAKHSQPEDANTRDAASLAVQAASTSAPRARSKAEELMQRELAAKRGREERANGGGGGGGRKDAPWLQTGIIVKVWGSPPKGF